jgi:hypothetical protein
MAKKPDMGEDMMSAMGAMPDAAAEPAAPAEPKEDLGDVSEEEMGFAQDMGFDATQAKALKRFIRSCMSSEEAGEYEEPAAEPEEMGEM